MLITPTSERHFIMYEALRKGATVEEIHELTKIKTLFHRADEGTGGGRRKHLMESKGALPSDEALTQAKNGRIL